jgi:hypothetical protein
MREVEGGSMLQLWPILDAGGREIGTGRRSPVMREWVGAMWPSSHGVGGATTEMGIIRCCPVQAKSEGEVGMPPPLPPPPNKE